MHAIYGLFALSSKVLNVGQCRLLGELWEVESFIPYKVILYYIELGLFTDLVTY